VLDEGARKEGEGMGRGEEGGKSRSQRGVGGGGPRNKVGGVVGPTRVKLQAGENGGRYVGGGGAARSGEGESFKRGQP